MYKNKTLSNICMNFYFSWGINDEQRSTVNGLHKILSNICVKFYFSNQDINVEQHSTVNGFALHLCNLRFGYLCICTNISVPSKQKKNNRNVCVCVCMCVNIYFPLSGVRSLKTFQLRNSKLENRTPSFCKMADVGLWLSCFTTWWYKMA